MLSNKYTKCFEKYNAIIQYVTSIGCPNLTLETNNYCHLSTDFELEKEIFFKAIGAISILIEVNFLMWHLERKESTFL
jgi:hypothetical protein